jgi:hypothetical protein
MRSTERPVSYSSLVSTSNMRCPSSDFLVRHPPVFTEATDMPEANSWLRTIEAKFSLVHCMEMHKTLFVAQ